ncbi:hypothetical protein NBRC116188_15520 [Oceaniserpentilla sp. 4NH20-0058]|uniref:hypothetical protein n=1 Tax=Oceaniserpentilla sp. 4NH20-0058 TaxID=3127660 RepID=UPI003103DD44
MMEINSGLLSSDFMQFWQATLAICALCFIIDAAIMLLLRGPHRSERSHYLICFISIGCYIALFPQDSEVFRQYWMQILIGMYLFDLCIIARDWHQLKSSYRVFYSIHHFASLCLFTVWHYTFVPFTDAMALGALLWVSSDIWRWGEQIWRLNGRHSSDFLRNSVDRLERVHRLLAYTVYLWVLDFEFQHSSEAVLLVSGIIMDAIDSYFVHKAKQAHRKAKANLTQTAKPNTQLAGAPDKQKTAA